MSDDIFIKHGLGTFQQPYNARQPVIAQEPNISTFQEPNIRNQQEPNIRNQQEPNIRNLQTTVTYQHRSPTTYNHRSPLTYNHRSPGSYQHRSSYNAQSPYISTRQINQVAKVKGVFNKTGPTTGEKVEEVVEEIYAKITGAVFWRCQNLQNEFSFCFRTKKYRGRVTTYLRERDIISICVNFLNSAL